MAVPRLGNEFTLTLHLGSPLHIGSLPTGGERHQRVINGGGIDGERLTGEVVAGAGEHVLLKRADGVGVIEASYLIRTADDYLVRMTGHGYRTGGEDGVMTLRVTFEADEHGPYEWLGRTMFLAYGDAGQDLVLHVAEVL